jgi:4'-phosphopantetheinyl transferase EntD
MGRSEFRFPKSPRRQIDSFIRMNLHSLDQALASDGRVIIRPSPAFSNAINRLSLGYILLEHAYLAPSFRNSLTPFERTIAKAFSERRKKSFIAARISLKLLALKIGLVNPEQEACSLETVNRENRRPILPGAGNDFYASVSHDKRFTLAVADRRSIGVDIEAISPKIAKAGHIFMDRDELTIAGSAAVGIDQAAAMVWTAKEAASKALNLHLIDAWHKVRLRKLGTKESIYGYDGEELKAGQLFEWDRVVSIISATA